MAWPAQLALARELAAAAGKPAEWPGLGRRDPGPLRLIIVPDGRVLDSLTRGQAPTWGAAVAVPGARTILLRADQGDLARTLRHELAHLALHEAVAVRVPLWFDEGLCGVGRGRMGAARRPRAQSGRGARTRFLRSPSSMARCGARNPPPTRRTRWPPSAVTELARRNPTGTLTPLLTRLEAGEDFDAAVLATTGLPVGRFEQEWQRTVKRRYTLGNWLIAGGGWVAGRDSAGLALVPGAGVPIGNAEPRSTSDGTWDPKPRKGLNLTRPRNGGSLMPYARFPYSGILV